MLLGGRTPPFLSMKVSQQNLKWENWGLGLDLGPGLHKDLSPPPASPALQGRGRGGHLWKALLLSHFLLPSQPLGKSLMSLTSSPCENRAAASATIRFSPFLLCCSTHCPCLPPLLFL